jgi:hypothetical protein
MRPIDIMKLRRSGAGGGGGGAPFSPQPGIYSDEQYATSCNFGISTSPTDASVVWTWTKSGSTSGASPVSGTAAANFSCYVTAGAGQVRSGGFTVNANKGGTNYGPWEITLTADQT